MKTALIITIYLIFSAICSAAVFSACMMSSMISRREEQAAADRCSAKASPQAQA